MGTFGVKRASDEPFCPSTVSLNRAIILVGVAVEEHQYFLPQVPGCRCPSPYRI